MPGDVDHVVDTAGDPVIAVTVAPAAVAGEILALVGGKVGVDEALVVAVDGPRDAGPSVENDEIAGALALDRIAVVVDERGLDAEEGERRRAGLELGRAGQRRNENAAGLGLPPRIDDRAASVANHVVIPLPGFGIDRLAHAAEKLERLPARARHEVVADAHQRPDRR